MTPLETARALEKAGRLEAAVKAFREAGAVDDAARVLGALKRPRDAAQLLLETLRVQPAQVGQLDPAKRKRALMAGIFFGRAGENATAVQLFLALGEQQRAVELLQKAGDAVGAARIASLKPGQFETAELVQPRAQATAVGGAAISAASAERLEAMGKLPLALEQWITLKRFADAARVAQALGRTADAAQLSADAGLPLQAARAYLALGDTGKALDNFCRVPRGDPGYRAACVEAIRLSAQLGSLDFKLEHLLGAFLAGGPASPDEQLAFDALARLYERHGLAGNARELLEKLAGAGFAGARERVSQLEALVRPDAALARAMVDDAPRRRPPPTALPDLPELPDVDDTTLAPQPTLAEIELEPEREAFTPGATVAGRYRLEKMIGQGGMAQVWKAFDTELDEDVALKVFAVQQMSEVLVQRFKQELKLSRQLMHPNIIRLHDLGLHEGHRYISMELLVGRSLKERMAQGIPFSQAIDLLVQACAGLQAVHDAGVVHRDVKPDNFFVNDKGVLKVMDFGIAKQHEAPGLTVAGSIAGTPAYMSPEQIGNFSQVTHLTDLYALGVTAYELFTGTLPFAHKELVPLLMLHVNQAPEPPRARNPHIPPALDAIILRLLEKNPAARFQSCRELGAALRLAGDTLRF